MINRIQALKRNYLPSRDHVLGMFHFADEKVTGNYKNLKLGKLQLVKLAKCFNVITFVTQGYAVARR